MYNDKLMYQFEKILYWRSRLNEPRKQVYAAQKIEYHMGRLRGAGLSEIEIEDYIDRQEERIAKGIVLDAAFAI